VVFKWDPKKATSNRKKHGVDFDEAATVLSDTLSTTFPDVNHSSPADQRSITVGMSNAGRVLVVVHSDHAHATRIISARRATRGEHKFYEEDQ
jgi:uncharacterized DUF497 family protein